MNAVWADGSGVGGLVDGYADEGDTISYTFTVRCTHIQRGFDTELYCKGHQLQFSVDNTRGHGFFI